MISPMRDTRNVRGLKPTRRDRRIKEEVILAGPGQKVVKTL